jgi:hypothetical protein
LWCTCPCPWRSDGDGTKERKKNKGEKEEQRRERRTKQRRRRRSDFTVRLEATGPIGQRKKNKGGEKTEGFHACEGMGRMCGRRGGCVEDGEDVWKTGRLCGRRGGCVEDGDAVCM